MTSGSLVKSRSLKQKPFPDQGGPSPSSKERLMRFFMQSRIMQCEMFVTISESQMYESRNLMKIVKNAASTPRVDPFGLSKNLEHARGPNWVGTFFVIFSKTNDCDVWACENSS